MRFFDLAIYAKIGFGKIDTGARYTGLTKVIEDFERWVTQGDFDQKKASDREIKPT